MISSSRRAKVFRMSAARACFAPLGMRIYCSGNAGNRCIQGFNVSVPSRLLSVRKHDNFCSLKKVSRWCSSASLLCISTNSKNFLSYFREITACIGRPSPTPISLTNATDQEIGETLNSCEAVPVENAIYQSCHC